MNVYVVSNCWAREGADVIGAGADLSDAMALGGDENGPWSDWSPVMVKPSGRFTKWARQSWHHPSLVQEIVMMPLAGMPTTVNLGAGEPRVTGSSPMTDALIRSVLSASAVMRGLTGELPSRIQVGVGAAWDYMERVADSVRAKNPGHALPTSTEGAKIAGIPIVRDPNIPADEIRIGTVVYVVGTASGFIREGQMVRFDMGVVSPLRVSDIKPGT